MIAIASLHHVSINVTDLARARQFYGGLLGLAELPRPVFDFDGAWYQIGDRQLHLIVHPPTRTLRGTREIDGRDGHFALRITGFEETLAYLEAHDVAMRVRRDSVTGWDQIFVTDPDGNVVELNAEGR